MGRRINGRRKGSKERQKGRQAVREGGTYLSHTIVERRHHCSKNSSVLILNVGKFLDFIWGCLKWLNVICTMDCLVWKI